MDTYDITMKGIPWKRGLLKLKKGAAFALYPPYFRPVKRPYMDYSKPILEEKLVVFVNRYPFKADFKNQLNHEIERMKQNGEIENIAKFSSAYNFPGAHRTSNMID